MEKTFREVIADIKPGEVWESDCKTITMDEVGDIGIENTVGIRRACMLFANETIYKLKQKPVTFKEVLNSYKRCRVEHELLEDISVFKEYEDFDYTMYLLGDNFEADELKKIIKEGKWYLEE